MRQTMAAASWIALSILAASGQTPAGAPEFEVASVKPAARSAASRMAGLGPGGTMPEAMLEMIGFSGGPDSRDPGRIAYSGVSLKMLLVRAYNVRPYQVSGPGWLDTESYDIMATLPPKTDKERLGLMLQKLLTERFQIVLHRETRELPVYTLTVAKSGTKLKPAEPQKPQEPPKQYESDDARQVAQREALSKAMAMAMTKKWDTPGNHGIDTPHVTVAQFVQYLTLDRPVLDLTGLDGLYDFTLHYDDGRGEASGDALSGPSIFAAIQEQLGLKLEPGKAPVEMLVIDKAEKTPVAN